MLRYSDLFPEQCKDFLHKFSKLKGNNSHKIQEHKQFKQHMTNNSQYPNQNQAIQDPDRVENI